MKVVRVLRVVLAGVFFVMGVSHFRRGPAKVMARMIPPTLRGTDPRTPARLVAFTGVCEIAGGVGLLVPPLAKPAAAALIAFLAAVFPANVYAARHPDEFGKLAVPFWPRLGFQLLLAALLAASLPRSAGKSAVERHQMASPREEGVEAARELSWTGGFRPPTARGGRRAG